MKNYNSVRGVKNSNDLFNKRKNIKNNKKKKNIKKDEDENEDNVSENFKSNLLLFNAFAGDSDDDEEDIPIIKSAVQDKQLFGYKDNNEFGIISSDSDSEERKEDFKKTHEDPSFMKFLNDFEQELNRMQKIKDKIHVFRQKQENERKEKHYNKDWKPSPMKQKYATPLESISELVPKTKPLKSDIFFNKQSPQVKNNSSLDKKLNKSKSKNFEKKEIKYLL